jgi:outer membrane receptor protein involved in Fe transport
MNFKKNGLFATSLLAGATLFSVAPSQAQEAASTPKAAPAEEVVVTGSRIPQPNLTSTSPVTQVTGADIQAAGITRVEDLINQLPQAFAAQNSTVANGASGTATVDLRGLGADRTLVLIDGRRMPYGSPNLAAADINQIPGIIVERIEVLTGGASAVYGSDAIAGVVNFITKKNFEGIKLDVQYGLFQHNNDFDGVGNMRNVIAARQATNPAQFSLPADKVDDGFSKEVSGMMGVSSADGKGNITAYATYRKNDEVLQRYRDFSACSLGGQATLNGVVGYACGGSSTAAPARITDFATYNWTIDQATGNTFRPFSGATDQYNFGPLNYFQRPDERYALGAFGNYEINQHAEVFTQLMFTDYRSVAQIAPSGYFLGEASIACNNPLLNASQRTGLGCTAADITAGNSISTFIGRRNVEGGARQDDLGYTSYRGVIGVRGNIVEGWDYEAAAQFSRVLLSRTYLNELSNRKTVLALDVVPDTRPGPGLGQPVCRAVLTGQDTNCVPWNIWRNGGVTPAALAYVGATGVQSGRTQQSIVSGQITGDLGTLGLKSPAAQDPMSVAFGVEYRRDELESRTDEAFTTNDLAGQGGPTIGLTGATEVVDLFTELRVPVAQDAPFAKLLQFDAAYRYSDYASGKTSSTYKVGAEWAPTDDLRVRGSMSKAVRSANVIELFTAQGLGLFDMDFDPCDAANRPGGAATRPANCIGSNPWQVTAAQSAGGGLDSPAGQYNFFGGGNPNLNPEEADTTTYGVVFTPGFLSGFSLSVDYFKIEVTDLVSSVGPLNSIAACYRAAPDAAACARIRRNANGQLWLGSGQVTDLNVNIGGLETSGIDINASYRLNSDDLFGSDFGSFTFGLVGTKLEKLTTDPGSGFPSYDCVGFYGNQCGIPNPEWRHRASVDWATPWNFSVGAAWRHYGEVELFVLGSNGGTRLDRYFDAENYLDLSGNIDLRKNVNLRLGMNNVFDNDPQLSNSVGTTGNGNTFPQTYDSNGRFVFAGISVDF